MAEEDIVRITVTPDVRDRIMRSVDWDRVKAMTEDEIERDLAGDPDAATFSDLELTAIRVQGARKKTGLTQPQFADRFGIPIGTLRDWEQARSEPDAAAMAYLRVIEHEPDAVTRALANSAG